MLQQGNEEVLDLLIINGSVIDGTGAPRRKADVGIRGDRIVAVGDLSHLRPQARQIVDAANLVVAPGLIDTHGHDDLMFLERPDLEWKTSQGVTTVVVGNCGVSGAPRPLPGNTAPALALLGKSALHASFHDYLRALESQSPVINVAALVGHGNLRLAAMEDPTAASTPTELRAMQELLTEALQAGAIGMSTGLAYEPGRAADTDELAALAQIIARYDAVHTSHIRDEGDNVEAAVEEILEIGRRASCRSVISHHKCLMPRNWGRSRRTLESIDHQRANGLDVALDVYPYNASSTILIPERAEVIDDIRITWSTPHPEQAGRYLGDIANEWQCSRSDAAHRLAPAGAIYFAMDEQEMRGILAHPCCMVGSDGLPNDENPHPRLWGTFTRVLGKYVREAQLLTLEDAIRKMTSLPASVFRLVDRGVLRPGAFADIFIFDPDVVEDRADWDNPTLRSVGVHHVFINGQAVCHGTAEMRAGRVLRHQHHKEESQP